MRKRHILIIPVFLLVLIPAFLSAQISAVYEEKGDRYYELCDSFFNLNTDSTLHYIQLAMDCFRKAEVWDKYLNTKNAWCTGLYNSGDFAAYRKCAVEAVDEVEKYIGEKSPQMSSALSNYASYLGAIGDYNKSIENVKKSLAIINESGDNELIISTLGNLGGWYLLLGDYNEALKYYFKGLSIGNENPESLSAYNRINTYNSIGNVFFKKEQLDSAKVYFNKSLAILSDRKLKLGRFDHRFGVNTNLNMADVFLKQNDPAKVRFYVSEAIRLTKVEDYDNTERAYEILGKLALQEKRHQQAISYFSKSKEIMKVKYSAFQKHYSIAEKDILLAETYQESGDLFKALSHYQEALQMLSRNDLQNDIYQLPDLDNIYSRLNVLAALNGKANTFFQLYHQRAKQKDLIAASETFQLASRLIQEVRKDYQQEGSLLQLSTRVLPIYEGAIETALALYERTNEERYLHQAFVSSESNKAILLLESMNESMAKGFAGIPDALLEKENDLRFELSYLKRTLNEEMNKGAKGNKKITEKYISQIFDLEQAYNNLIAKFEQEYPKYYQLKYNTQLVSVPEIQKQFSDQTTNLIEYFFGEKKIYIFSVSAKEIKVHSLAKEEKLLSSIQKVRMLVSQPPVNGRAEDFNDFVKCAHDIFDKLLAPGISVDARHLIIITDDRLGYLPFETLLTNTNYKKENLYSLKNLSYLLEEYEISYNYSATLFLNAKTKNQENIEEVFLGVAPSFQSAEAMTQRSCGTEQLYSLTCNQKEVKAIQELFGGEVLLEQKATKTHFEAAASHCKILHLATHACLDDKNPEFSKIHLADDYISGQDLYNLRLNAEMAVLSACDTGSGQLVEGEGVMSLARGFIHAGCPSVVMSLWSVDDCATSDIMIDFYKNLKSDYSKSQAIRQAKLNYISSAKKAQQHPFYWAAFVQIGDFEPLSFSSKSNDFFVLKLALAFALLILIAFLLFARNKALKSEN